MTSALATRPGVLLLSRLLAAVLGGYLLASALAVLLAAALPPLWGLSRAEAVLAGVQWSFVAHVLVVIWAFSPVALARMWVVLLSSAAAMAAAAWLLVAVKG